MDMKKIRNKLNIPSGNRLPILLMMMAVAMEFVFITLESMGSYIGYYLVEDYIFVPCMLFAGVVLSRKVSGFARSRFLLAAMALAWFVLIQFVHKLSDMGTHPVGTVFFVYLMAFPFASVIEDCKSIGMKLVGFLFVTSSLVLVAYTLLLLLGAVPTFMEPYVFWDGTRLHALWHPNISACFFMLGIGFCWYFFFKTKNSMTKIMLTVSVAVQFFAMALTNCRTTLLLTSGFFGGIAFFRIYKSGLKQLLAGVLAAALIMAGCFMLSGKVYGWNSDILYAKAHYEVQTELVIEEAAVPMADVQSAETEIYAEVAEEEPALETENPQGTLVSDLRTLNGRTIIWGSLFSVLRDNKDIALWGTEYVGTAISSYNPFPVVHSHNSWTEALARMGIVGLLFALVFTWLGIRSAWKLLWDVHVEMEKKILVMLTLCLMVTGFLEPYLFITNVYYHVTDFAFFFLVGYLDFWAHKNSTNKGFEF